MNAVATITEIFALSQQHNPIGSAAPRVAAPAQTAAVLRELARRAEQAGFDQQADFITAALDALAEPYECLFPGALARCRLSVPPLVQAGAPESAVLTLLPSRASFTCGRMHDGRVIAQVLPDGVTGDHSRDARWLAMAWLAALLRAIATLIDEPAAPSASR